MSKKPYHKFNRTLDEPAVALPTTQPGSRKIAVPTFEADIALIEGVPNPVAGIAGSDTDHLKFLFGELGSLLSQDTAMAEEAVNTNPVPMEPTLQNPPSTVQPVAGPVPTTNAGVQDPEDEEDPTPTEPVAPPVVEPLHVSEAKVADFHEVADTLTRPYRAPVVPAPVPTPAPAPAPTPVVQPRTGWVFTVHRNKQTNLIERIEADPKTPN